MGWRLSAPDKFAPDGFAHVGWRGVITSAVFGCLFPSVLGGVVVGGMQLAGTENLGAQALSVWLLATVAVVSPLLSGPGFLVTLPVVAGLLRRGWYGWLSALALGLAMGGIVSAILQNALALPFAVTGFALQRWVTGRLYPKAFQPSGTD
ncbi:MAG: hypothetical protein V4712_13660 [Pseudomonadota bacterium]